MNKKRFEVKNGQHIHDNAIREGGQVVASFYGPQAKELCAVAASALDEKAPDVPKKPEPAKDDAKK